MIGYSPISPVATALAVAVRRAIHGNPVPPDNGGVIVPPAFNPASLFANGEQGAVYDPSDFSTMFQDAAGTVPVTAVGQPVGLIKDKSGRGNHASQATSTQRPVIQVDGNGHFYLAFDGVDDVLQTGSPFQNGAGFHTTAAFSITSAMGINTCVMGTGLITSALGATGLFQRSDIVQRVATGFYVGLTARQKALQIDSSFVVGGAPIVADAWQTPDTLYLSTGDAAPITIACASGVDTAPVPLYIGAGTALAFYGGVHILRPLTALEAVSLPQYLKTKAGIAP